MEAGDFNKAFPKLARRLGDRNAALATTLMTEREVPAGSVLIDERTRADKLFLVVDGEFRIEVARTDGAVEISRIGHGKWIGEVPLFFSDRPSVSRVIAAAPCRVLELPHDRFWSAREENPDLLSALTRELVDHLSERVRATDELIVQSLPQRDAPGQA